MSGYINSQTWEAWFESYEVSWNNTSFIFIVSVALSMAIVIATWMMSVPSEERDHKEQEKNERKKLQDIQEANTEEESEEEEKEEMEEKRIGKLLEFNQLPGEVKKVEHQATEKKVETQMSAEQLMAERKAQSEQLAAIFKMMQDQEEKFGETTIDEIKDQMKLYCG